MLKQKLLADLITTLENSGFKTTDIVCTIPKNSAFGDYTTNIALQLANQKSGDIKQTVPGIAKKIVDNFPEVDYLEKIEVAGSGFINFFIKESALLENIPKVCNYSSLVNPETRLTSEAKRVEVDQKKKKILIEFGDPNTHKAIHIGHVRNFSLGESICRLLEATGNEVFRANYQGDIGLHVAKALWGVLNLKQDYEIAKKADLNQKIIFLGKAYTMGATGYEDNEQIKKEIDELNKQLYLKNKKVVPIWEETKQWSLDYFETVYENFGIKYDFYTFESEAEGIGREYVEKNMDKVFKKDAGAVIFPGEKYGLHNRVFITSAGHPTYEAKEIGVTKLQRDAFDYNQALIVVANEVDEYFKVVLKALEMIFPDLEGRKRNLAYGYVNLAGGKMSSRKGNVVTWEGLYSQVKEKIMKLMNEQNDLTQEEKAQIIDVVSIGAIKFSMLKYAPQTDITFDIEKSVSLEGDSGPYIQYAYARAKSVLRNAQYDYTPGAEGQLQDGLEKEERLAIRQIEHFESVLEEAAKNFAPQDLAEYLVNLAKLFNLFYQKHPIIKAGDKMELRLALTCAVAVVLKQGLYLLGIEAPERM